MDLGNITVNAQSSIRIKGDKVLYFDAFRIDGKSEDADYIFVTHEHFDHFDVAAIKNVWKKDSVVIAPESMKKKLLGDLGIAEDRCIFMKPGQVEKLEGVCVEAVPAYNVLKPFHPKHNKWLGYKVSMNEITYYIAGDTDANEDVKKVSCDVALVPVGGMYTMDKKQAAELVLLLKPKAAIPTHYGDVAGKPGDGAEFKRYVENSNADIQVELKL